MKTKQKIESIRLQNSIIPYEYNIKIRPDLDKFTFSGEEEILIKILKKTKKIILHSKDLTIKNVRINSNFQNNIKDISYDKNSETAIFIFEKEIKKGETTLELSFEGILNENMRGFYKSSYKIGKRVHHMATTQFEATDARRAFPCFDEPSHKAIFNVSLIIPKNKTAISNTIPIEIKEHEAGFNIVKFSPTPKMSTYLLAFIIGDLEYIESKTKNGTQVRVFTTLGKKKQAKFALDCAVKTLEFYEKYFDIRYPLPVLDMIAIPDFASGAMENWGAITYRETALLVDEEHSSISNKQWVALVIAHELAHQWFGNLVTMEWWTHLWLNEGFASYIEYLAVDKIFPEWDIWTQFSINDLGVALKLDSLENTHPIEVEVHNPNQIGEIFDEVSYSKGASIIKMLADYIGEKNFRDGLRYYLKKHSYKNTETIHLWEAFEKISKKDISNLMKNWTSKSGYPLIKANLKNNYLEIEQERFFINPISKRKNKENTLWNVPIIINKKKFLSKKKKILLKENFKKINYIKINSLESGFFRTKYSEELLNKLRKQIENQTLTPRDRIGIIRDLFALAESSYISTVQVLKFLESYRKENNYTVWAEISSSLSKIEQIVANTEIEKPINELIENLFSPIALSLGFDKKNNEFHTDALLRSLSISRAGCSGNKEIIKKSKILLKKKFISPDIRSAIYSVIATNGNTVDFKNFIKKYKKEELHEEKNRIGNALGLFKDKNILKMTCEFAISKDVRMQDSISILSSVALNPLGRDIWLDFINKNWNIIISRYGNGGHSLGRLIKSISLSSQQDSLDKFIKIIKKNSAPGAERAIEQTIEKIKGNILWINRDTNNLKKYFNNY